MRQEIDEQVVLLQLESDDFNRDVETTIKNLKKLDTSLQFENAEDGLSKVEKTTKTLKNRLRNFKPLEWAKGIGDTVFKLRNLEYGLKRVASAVPGFNEMISGWQQYETLLVTVGGIVNNISHDYEDLTEANQAVAESMQLLMQYADETSFSFTTMSEGIKQFTVSGIELKEATAAAIGVTSVAGAAKVFDKYKVQSAMDAISKSIAMGYTDMLRWNQLTNTAGIVTQEFSQALIDAAVAQGTLVKYQNKSYATAKSGLAVTTKNIRATLADKWLTDEVWTTVLARYSDAASAVEKLMADDADLSAYEALMAIEAMDATEQVEKFGHVIDELGLKAYKSSQETSTLTQAIESVKDAIRTKYQQIYQNILGDAQEAVELWSSVSNTLWSIFVPALNAVNDILTQWRENGGFTDFSEGVLNFFSYLELLASKIGEAFTEVFGILNSSGLSAFTKAFRDWTENLVENERAGETFKTILKSILLYMKIMGKIMELIAPVISIILDYVSDLLELLNPAMDFISDLIDIFVTFLNGLRLNKSDLKGFADGTISFLKSAQDVLEWIIKALHSPALENIGDVINDIISFFRDNTIEEGVNKLKKFLEDLGIVDALKKVKDELTIVYNYVKSKILGLVQKVQDAFDPAASVLQNILNIAGVLAPLLATGGVIYGLTKLFRITGDIGGVLRGLERWLKWSSIRAIAEALKGLAAVIGALALNLLAFSALDSSVITKVGLFTIAFTALIGALTVATTLTAKKSALKARSFLGIGTMFIGMATVFASIAKILYAITPAKIEALPKMTNLITQTIVALGIAVVAINRLSGKEGEGGSFWTVIGVTIAFGFMMDTIRKVINKYQDVNFELFLKYKELIYVVLGVISLLTLLFTAIKTAKFYTLVKNMETTVVKEFANARRAASFVASIGGLALLVSSIALLVQVCKNTSWDDIWHAATIIGALTVFLTAIYGFGRLFSRVYQLGGKFNWRGLFKGFSYENPAQAVALPSLGRELAGMVGAMLGLLWIIKLTNDMTPADYKRGIINMALLSAVAIGLYALVGLVNNIISSSEKMYGTGGVSRSLGALVFSMISVLLIMSILPKDQVETALWAIGGMMAVMSLLAIASGLAARWGKENIGKLGWIITSMALLMAAFAFAIYELQGVPLDKIWLPLTILGVIVAIVPLMASLAALISKDATSVLGIIAIDTIILLVGGLAFVMGYLVQQLGAISESRLQKLPAVLIAIGGVFTALIAVLGLFASAMALIASIPGVGTIGSAIGIGALAVLGGVFLALGYGVEMAGKGFKHFADGLQAVQDVNLVSLGAGLGVLAAGLTALAFIPIVQLSASMLTLSGLIKLFDADKMSSIASSINTITSQISSMIHDIQNALDNTTFYIRPVLDLSGINPGYLDPSMSYYMAASAAPMPTTQRYSGAETEGYGISGSSGIINNFYGPINSNSFIKGLEQQRRDQLFSSHLTVKKIPN